MRTALSGAEWTDPVNGDDARRPLRLPGSVSDRPGDGRGLGRRRLGREQVRRRGVVPIMSTDAPALTMYTTTWCGCTNRLKTGPRARRDGDEVNIEEDPRAADYVGSVNNGNHVVPTIKYADGTTATNPSIVDVRKKLGL